MSDRRAWLEEWCPYCRAAPGSRCRLGRYSSAKRPSPVQSLHAARGWRERPCPTCRARPGDPCHTPSGREASQPHTARLRPGRSELATRQAVWEELGRRGATVAVVPFSGRAGQGGTTGTITLSRLEGRQLVHIDDWSVSEELVSALEAPVWDRYGQFAGHPWIRGTVTWTLLERRILICGHRGGISFEETLA